ncbi:MAG: hypothetical protein LBH56_01115 [Coriobacteriales bacterium]|jgi:hypothetical protein|nr:hypothetical protein [Coriobacteriales bacterium]
MIEQITVFLENEQGRLAALCRALGDADVSMRALTVADTAQYGVARIIPNDLMKAYETLGEKGFRVSRTKVIAVKVPDCAGGLATLLEVLDEAHMNVEYAYCFAVAGNTAIDILRIDNHEEAEKTITAAGFYVMSQEELYA